VPACVCVCMYASLTQTFHKESNTNIIMLFRIASVTSVSVKIDAAKNSLILYALYRRRINKKKKYTILLVRPNQYRTRLHIRTHTHHTHTHHISPATLRDLMWSLRLLKVLQEIRAR